MKDQWRYIQPTSRTADLRDNAIEANLYSYDLTRPGYITRPITSRWTDRRYLLAQQCFPLAQRLRVWSTFIRRAAFSNVKKYFFVTKMQSRERCLLLKFRTTMSLQCGGIREMRCIIQEFMFTYRSQPRKRSTRT
jgi:hypothetical protein